MSRRLKPVHPGSILKEELEFREVTQTRVAGDLNVSYLSINKVCNEKRPITPNTAVRLEKYLGTSAEMWLNIQGKYDIGVSRIKLKKELEKIPELQVA